MHGSSTTLGGLRHMRRRHGDDDPFVPCIRGAARIVVRIVGDVDTASDIVTDTWVKLTVNAAGGAEILDPCAYFRTSAVHRALNHLRSGRRRALLEASYESGRASVAPGADIGIEWVDVVDCLRKLRPLHRDLLVLVDAGGYTQDAAAAMFGIRRTQVGGALVRARTAVRRCLERGEGGTS